MNNGRMYNNIRFIIPMNILIHYYYYQSSYVQGDCLFTSNERSRLMLVRLWNFSIKFSFSEKAIHVKTMRKIAQIFEAFSEKLNFKCNTNKDKDYLRAYCPNIYCAWHPHSAVYSACCTYT